MKIFRMITVSIVTCAQANHKMLRVFFLIILFVAKLSIVNSQDDLEFDDTINGALKTVLPVNIVEKIADRFFDFSIGANKCAEQVGLLLNRTKNKAEWALKMIDASSKLPSGILMGNTVDLGMYDECVSINIVENGDEIRGRHCMYSVLANIGKYRLTETLSICLPATCNEENLKSILEDSLELINVGFTVPINISETTCSNVESPKWTTGGIITILGFSLLLLFLAICTICDITLRTWNNNFSTNSKLVLLCKFSVYSNAIRILSTKSTPQTLPAIQGLRFFSMCWVILGHEYYMARYFLPMNSLDFKEWLLSWNSVYIMIAPFAVDTFFTISGFLMGYLFLKEMSKGRSFNIFGYYIHRYLRLTPAYAALLLMAIFIFPRMGSGALWDKIMGKLEDDCSKNWWPMLLYVHNYVNKEHFGCLGHSWYLAVEMHFFWISPFILIPLSTKPKIGLSILAVLFLTSIYIPAKISYDDKMVSGLFVNNDLVNTLAMDFYTSTHNRGSAWLVGIFFGYLFFKKNERPDKTIELLGWLLTAAAFSFCIYGARNFQKEGYEYDEIWETFYTSVSRPAWSIGVAWIIFAGVLGFGGPVTKILSLSIFHPFSRISYCVYLVHFAIQTMKISAIRAPRYFNDFNTFNYFLSDFILSVVIGFVFSLVFESPILILEKLLIKRSVNVTPTLTNGVKIQQQ